MGAPEAWLGRVMSEHSSPWHHVQGSPVPEEDGGPSVYPGVTEPFHVPGQPQQDHPGDGTSLVHLGLGSQDIGRGLTIEGPRAGKPSPDEHPHFPTRELADIILLSQARMTLLPSAGFCSLKVFSALTCRPHVNEDRAWVLECDGLVF